MTMRHTRAERIKPRVVHGPVPDDWTVVEFYNGNNADKIAQALDELTTGKFCLTGHIIRFENEKDAVAFKLKMR